MSIVVKNWFREGKFNPLKMISKPSNIQACIFVKFKHQKQLAKFLTEMPMIFYSGPVLLLEIVHSNLWRKLHTVEYCSMVH